MEANGCVFPEGLEYSPDMNLWFRKERHSDSYRVGMTSALLWLAGKQSKITLKPAGTAVGEGKSIGSIETPRFFDTMRVPFPCVIENINGRVASGETVGTRSIYEEHWLAVVAVGTRTGPQERLVSGEVARNAAVERVEALRLQCFAELPDVDMVEIGSECSAVLSRLSHLVENKEKGFTVHLVTDDLTSPIEMVRWADETGNRLLETRKIVNIYHFIAVRK